MDIPEDDLHTIVKQMELEDESLDSTLSPRKVNFTSSPQTFHYDQEFDIVQLSRKDFKELRKASIVQGRNADFKHLPINALPYEDQDELNSLIESSESTFSSVSQVKGNSSVWFLTGVGLTALVALGLIYFIRKPNS